MPMFMRGDKKPEGYAWKQATLRNAVKARINVLVWCEECQFSVSHLPVHFSLYHGIHLDTTLWALAQRLRCSRCNSRHVGVRLDA